MKFIIIIIVAAGLTNTAQAQLASERPVASFYSKTTRDKLQQGKDQRQPAAQNAQQVLPSQQAVQQPSVPRQIKVEKKRAKRDGGRQQLASEVGTGIYEIYGINGRYSIPSRRSHKSH